MNVFIGEADVANSNKITDGRVSMGYAYLQWTQFQVSYYTSLVNNWNYFINGDCLNQLQD